MSARACFGVITCFDGDSETCQACNAVKPCQRECMTTLATLSTVGESTRLQKKHQRWAIKYGNKPTSSPVFVRENYKTSSDDKLLTGLSKAATDIAKAVIHNYVDLKTVTSDIVESITPRYLAIMLNKLVTGIVKTREIKDALISELQWKASTAKSYAAGFIELLVAWKIVRKIQRGIYEVLK